MAEETRTILIDVEVDQRDFDKELGDVNTQLRKNRELIKELSEDYEANAKEIAQLERANKELSQSKREIIKESQTEANSLNALRLRLASLTKERNNLDTSIESNVERFNMLQKEIKSTSDEIKGFEQAGGDFRRNVGNYSDSVGEAVGQTQIFGTSLNDLGGLLTSTTGLIGGAVGALGALFKAYTSSARGAEDLQRATDRLNEVYNTFSQTLADTFGTDGEGGILDRALKSLLSRVTSTETQVRAEIAATAAERLRDLELIEVQEQRDAKQRLQRAEQLRQIRDDETEDIRTRINANEELFESISTREQAIIDFNNRRLQQLELLLKLDPQNRDIRREILQTEFEIADIQEEAEGFRSEALINRISLNRELLELTQQRTQLEAESLETLSSDLGSDIDQIIAADNRRADARIKNSQAIIKANDAVIVSNEQLLEAGASLTNSVIQLAGQQSATGKALALSQIVANSARGISGAIAAGAGIPFPGNLAAIATGVAAVVSGIAQARAVLSEPTPSIGGQGGSGGFSTSGGVTTNVASQVQQATVIQPQLLSQFSQPVQNQQDLVNAASTQQQVQSVVSVVDIKKGLNANNVVVTESSL